ncbi:STM4014 family protein [Ammonicoccus fulvus]|uniref:STM4014 family protein n=1 Tax=Ammonicoccus fulvus TaxID=3138240 RepID=A0ABZ3FSG9_9ACTN
MSDLLILGSAGGKRTQAVQASLARAALPPARVLDQRVFLTGTPGPADDWVSPGTIVRLESPSEDPGVDAELVALGGGVRPEAPTELIRSDHWHRGLTVLLGRVEAWLADAPAHHRLQHTPSILAMMDKRATHARLRAAGVPVPESFDASTWAEVVEQASARGWNQVFVKARYGSSAAGILAARWGDSVVGFSTVAWTKGRAVNVRRPVRYSTHAEIAEVVEAIGPFHVERWLPKVTAPGSTTGPVDFRVVVIGGRAQHLLARIGRGPFTNLHLGAERGDLELLRAHFGERNWASIRATAEAAAACFPEALYAGVDVGLVHPSREAVVWEVNAFGDFHEGIEVDGKDTYQAQLAAMIGVTA